ncbi:MAG: substrate-binding domain-containing protein, partial [Gammaproteobacteria bacterium]|nr:substrate-binding domain-containing protein [Gammaproteobacteria bacterium]
MANKSKRKIASLQDLADLAGVSRATASRALNDSPLISEATRRKLQALAKKHAYQINRRARDFRLRKTSVISVVFMLDIKSHQHMSDPFFLDMLGALADAMAEHDYDLLLAHAPIEDVLALRDSRVIQNSDGVIFVGQAEQHAQLDELATVYDRMVVWGYPVVGKSYPVVGGDNLRGGLIGTRHLLETGRRKIAFFGGTDNPENQARLEGYQTALYEAGLDAAPHRILPLPFEMERAREELARAIDDGLEFDGAVCASDVMALAVLSALQATGLRVPEDVAVVGYDDISLAAY